MCEGVFENDFCPKRPPHKPRGGKAKAFDFGEGRIEV
jgi:hypothetical protein